MTQAVWEVPGGLLVFATLDALKTFSEVSEGTQLQQVKGRCQKEQRQLGKSNCFFVFFPPFSIIWAAVR